MPRFFAERSPSPPTNTRLRNLAPQFQTESAAELGPFLWTWPWEVVDKFLDAAEQDGLRVFHNPSFRPPAAAKSCRGAESLGYRIRNALAKKYTLHGEGALIIIADDGLRTDLLKQLPMKFDANVVGPGQKTGPRLHGTMCAADAFMAAPKATYGDLSVLTAEGVLASSLDAAFKGLVEGKHAFTEYHACIVSVSLQVTLESVMDDIKLSRPQVRFHRNPDHPLWKSAGDLPLEGFDVLVAAGNDGCHPGAPGMRGLALHPSLLTVASVDVSGVVEPSSSHGIQGEKPDLACYSNFLWSGVYDNYDDGTSAATALAAGVLASFRTSDKARFRREIPPPQFHHWVRSHLNKNPHIGVAIQDHSARYGWGVI